MNTTTLAGIIVTVCEQVVMAELTALIVAAAFLVREAFR